MKCHAHVVTSNVFTGSSYISQMSNKLIKLEICFTLRVISSRLDLYRHAARSRFCVPGYENSSEIVGNRRYSSPFGVRSESVRNLSFVSDRCSRTQDQQKPDRAACRSIEPGRNLSQNKSKTQGKFIVLLIYLSGTSET